MAKKNAVIITDRPRGGELKLEKYFVLDVDLLIVSTRLLLAVLVCCLLMQVLGCHSGEESVATNIDSKPTAEQQQPAADAEVQQQLMEAQTLLGRGNADQAWELVNQVLVDDAHRCECFEISCQNQTTAG